MRNQYQFKVIITLEEGDECTQDEIKDIVEDYLELGCNNESIGGNCKVESLSDLKDKLVKHFTAIEDMADELTTGNVAHKKVIELIKKGISYWNRSTYITSYEDDARECFNEAIKELSKSDWISVEDRLPEFGENVVARTKGGYMNVSYRSKIPRDRISKEIMDDNGFILNFNLHSEKIAYWHKIDKLEE